MNMQELILADENNKLWKTPRQGFLALQDIYLINHVL